MKKKIGLQPGSLVYTGKVLETVEIPITHYFYNNKISKVISDTYSDGFSIKIDEKATNWIDVAGIHKVSLIESFGKLLQIDSLILEDILNNKQRTKLEIRDNLICIILKVILLNDETEEYEYEQISFIIQGNTLVSFQEKENNIFTDIKRQIENRNGKIVLKKTDYLLYTLLDRVVDNYFLIIDKLEEKIDNLENKIITNISKADFEDILELKKEIVQLKKAVFPLKEIISKFLDRKMKEFLGEEIDIYLKDLQDHILIVNEATDTLVGRSADLIQLYHSTLSTNMNEIMKILAMISTIFIPLSFIAGLYGMNFQVMPELTWKYGYYFVLFIMFIIFVGSLIYFKKKRWW